MRKTMASDDVKDLIEKVVNSPKFISLLEDIVQEIVNKEKKEIINEEKKDNFEDHLVFPSASIASITDDIVPISRGGFKPFPITSPTDSILLQFPSPRIEYMHNNTILISSYEEITRTYYLSLVHKTLNHLSYRTTIRLRPIAVSYNNNSYICIYPSTPGTVDIVKYSNSLIETSTMVLNKINSISRNMSVLRYKDNMYTLTLSNNNRFTITKKPWISGNIIYDIKNIVYISNGSVLCKYDINSSYSKPIWTHIVSSSYPVESIYAQENCVVYTSGTRLNVLDEKGSKSTYNLSFSPLYVTISNNIVYLLGDDSGLYTLNDGKIVQCLALGKVDVGIPFYIQDSKLYYTTNSSVYVIQL